MLRKYVNSTITVLSTKNQILDGDNTLVIQTERLSDELILCETISRDEMFELIPFGMVASQEKPKAPQVDENLVYDYRETIINNDPFGKYSGEKIGKIFDLGDSGWIKNAIKNMKNQYIKDRVSYLAKYYEVV